MMRAWGAWGNMTTHSRDQKLRFRRKEDNPGLVREKKKSAMRGLMDSAQVAVKSGFKAAGKKERARRLGICHTCPERIGAGMLQRCRQCGCVLSFKSALAAWGCPLEKW